jgi:hypothetical protein
MLQHFLAVVIGGPRWYKPPALGQRHGLVTANVAAAAIALGAAQAMAPAAPVHAAADAELVELCRRWIRMCRVYEHACVREGPCGGRRPGGLCSTTHAPQTQNI